MALKNNNKYQIMNTTGKKPTSSTNNTTSNLKKEEEEKNKQNTSTTSKPTSSTTTNTTSEKPTKPNSNNFFQIQDNTTEKPNQSVSAKPTNPTSNNSSQTQNNKVEKPSEVEKPSNNNNNDLTLDKITDDVKEDNTYKDELQNSYKDYLDRLDNQYNETLNKINASSLNAKNEIAIAEQNTAKYIDNYLKSQGLYGSGMGGSLALGNINNANSLRNQVTQNEINSLLEAENLYNDAVNEYSQNHDITKLEQAITNIDNMTANGSTKEDIKEYLNKYMQNTNLSNETKDYLEDYLNNISGAVSWTEGRDTTVNELAQVITQITDATQRSELQAIAQKIYNAKTQEEYNNALNEYEDYVNKQLIGGTSTEEVIGITPPSAPETENVFSVSSEGSYDTKQPNEELRDFYEKIDAPTMAGLDNGKQGTYVKSIISNARNKKLNDNIVIDINLGGGEYYVYYENGKFYALGSSIPTKYSTLPRYDENNINSALNS